MNAEKNPRQARKIAKESKKLQQLARKNPNKLKGKDAAKARRQIQFDNLDEPLGSSSASATKWHKVEEASA